MPTRRDKRRKIVSLLNNLTWAVMAWILAWPHPYIVAIGIAALLPVTALAMAWRWQGIALMPGRGKAGGRPAFDVALIMPGLVLSLRGLIDSNILDWHRALTPALAVAAVFTLGIRALRQDVRHPNWQMLFIFPLTIAYGWGVFVFADRLADRAEPVRYEAEILGKHITGGRSSHPQFHLGPWGPKTTESDVDVGWKFYRAAQPGDHACIDLAPGALGAAWYVVKPCASDLP